MLSARLRLARVVPYQGSTTPFIGNFFLAVCSGLLLVFAFPEWNLWSLSWVGPAPLIMALAREHRFWRSLALGSVTGTIFYVGTSHWVTYSMHNYGGMPLWACYAIGLVPALILGSFTGLFAGVIATATGRFGGWALLSSPVVWPATEWLRLKLTGMGWNALGYSQAFHPAVIQIARWGGVYAVSALLVLASTALVFGVIYLERPRGFLVFSVASLIVISAVLYGLSFEPGEYKRSIPIAAVQPNVPISDRFADADFVSAVTDRYLSLSERAIQSAPSRPVLIVWPEAQVNIEYDGDLMLQQKIASFTTRNKVWLLINSWRYPDDQGPRNSAMVIGPSGDKVSHYDKIALMPFGEYVPARGLIPLMDEIPALVGDVTPGDAVTLSDVSGARLGTFICFEALRPEIAREMKMHGASVLVQISNEAWFGPSAAPRQIMAHAIFRAVENNVDLVRATNSGLSARINRYGRVEGLTSQFETAIRNWNVESVEEAKSFPATFYTRYGDVFAVGCVVLTGLLAAASLIRPKAKES